MPDIFDARVKEVLVPPTLYIVTTTTVTQKWNSSDPKDRIETVETREEWRALILVEGAHNPELTTITRTFATRAQAMKLQEGDVAYRH